MICAAVWGLRWCNFVIIINILAKKTQKMFCFARWTPGACVRIKGLQVQKNLNGLCGNIVDWDTTEERWKAGWDDVDGFMLGLYGCAVPSCSRYRSRVAQKLNLAALKGGFRCLLEWSHFAKW